MSDPIIDRFACLERRLDRMIWKLDRLIWMVCLNIVLNIVLLAAF
jgi:hypothetical protein